MCDGGCFGHWNTDSDGLPCFDVEISRLLPGGLVLPDGDARRMWHQVGNERFTATAHAGGWTTVYSTEDSLVRLSGTDPSRAQELGGLWSLCDPSGRELTSPFVPGVELVARWGAGYAEWRASAAGFELTRRLWAPFGDLSAARIDVSITASRRGPLPACSYTERWGFRPYPVFPGPLMSRRIKAPVTYTRAEKLAWYLLFTGSSLSRRITEAARAFLGARMALDAECDPEHHAVILSPRKRGVPRRPPRRSVFPGIPGIVFAATLSPGSSPGAETALRSGATGRSVATTVELTVPVDAGEVQANLSFAVGITAHEELPALLDALRDSAREESASSWKGAFSLELASAPEIEREALWHAYYLSAATVREPCFSCRFVPQGSAYGYIHGMHGAPRDYAITSVPLTYIDPPVARDMLRLMMRLTRPDGAMAYAHTGSGVTTSAIVHGDPTDLPLFFLWALTEHVWATGDHGFLEEEVPFRQRRRGDPGSGTVMERALLAWRHTRDAVGTGEHGMLLSGSGDWNDPIALMTPALRDFHRRGESAFNTAMAVYVLPRAAELVSATYPVEAAAMREYTDRLREAMERAWCGRWFLRGWDGRGGPIGSEHLFLDAQVWCLIARIGTDEQRRTLVDAIAGACDDPSPIGATILDRPHPVRMGMLAPGWDCNGGVWSAINGLLTWAYALHDARLAWRSLEKQSLAAHARAYPHVWYGIWSGPDSYNAHYAERPGETYMHPATPMSEFPVMNSNAHAGPLLAVLKALGVEAGPSGVFIEPRLTEEAGPWRLSTTFIEVEGGPEGARVARGPAPR